MAHSTQEKFASEEDFNEDFVSMYVCKTSPECFEENEKAKRHRSKEAKLVTLYILYLGSD